MCQNIINAGLNTIFVSVPEVLIWSIAVLIFLQRKDLLDIYFWKENLKQILLIPVIPIAISINLMRYILHIDNLTNFILIEIMMSCLMIYLIKKNNFLNEKINYIKIILYVILADFLVIFMVEGFYIIAVTLLLDKTITQINNTIFLNIIISIIPRLIQILLIVLYFHKKNFDSKISYIEVIFKNKVLSISTLVFLITSICAYFMTARLLAETQILQNYKLLIQIFSSMLVLLIPSTLIMSYIISICNLINKNIKLQQEKENIYENTI